MVSNPGNNGAQAPCIRLRLFASLREQAGWAERTWSLPAGGDAPITARQVWSRLELPAHGRDIRIAINQHFADLDTPLQDGDELAFLPPITGG